MILSTHALAGAAVASFFPEHPIAAFFLGAASHFATDAIPHWDYRLHSYEGNSAAFGGGRLVFDKRLLRDFAVAAGDGLLGLFLSLFFVSTAPPLLWSVFSGAVGGMIPDFFQLVYYRFPDSFMRHLQRFHFACHTKTRLHDRPWIGIPFQIVIALILIAILVAQSS